MIRPPAEDEAVPACLALLEASLPAPASLPERLTDFSPQTLEAAFLAIARRRGDAALPLLARIADGAASKDARKAARRVLYRLRQAGLTVARELPKPALGRGPERPQKAWVSGVDGTGSRALWIVFGNGWGGLALCALIVNDQVGILEAAGAAISKKRLDGELRSLRESQKLPWLPLPPARAEALVREALALHARLGTEPPPEFARWRRLFEGSPPDAGGSDQSAMGASPAGDDAPGDRALLDHSAELLDLPELATWFVDPGAIQGEALELLTARESRLVLSDQIKAEREAGIVDRVVDRTFTPDARELWARRLREMAWVFEATGRPRETSLAQATARALGDSARTPRHLPFARGLAQRGLAFASEVALGRQSAAEVSRAPRT